MPLNINLLDLNNLDLEIKKNALVVKPINFVKPINYEDPSFSIGSNKLPKIEYLSWYSF